MEKEKINLERLINDYPENLPDFTKEKNIIYCCENLINGKVYIGETKRTLRERWVEHNYLVQNKNKGDVNMVIHDAIRKYGLNNFSVYVLENNLEAEDERKEREKYWISQYNSFIDSENSGGYNMTTGGRAESKFSSTKAKKGMKTCLEKYGYLPIQTKESREKSLETNRKNHNGQLAFQTKESRKKSRETQIKKYGSLYIHLPEFKIKAQKALKEKYGETLPFNTKEAILKAQKLAPLYRMIGNINRHILKLKEKSLEVNSKNYIFASQDTKRMWQQHVPNVLRNIEELRKLNVWTEEMEKIFSNISYDTTKKGINKIVFK